MNETFLTPEQVAERLQVELETVRVWLRSGKMRGVKLSESKRSAWRVAPEDFALWVKQHRN